MPSARREGGKPLRAGPLERTRILVTNDDGIDARGIKILARIARTLSKDVWVVAPETEQSAASHSLTVRTPLRLRRLGPRRFAVNGTPTDCVLIAVGKVMEDHPPDLVLSGINQGGNMAEDISHSGTVAGAMQAVFMGIRGIALSLITTPAGPPRWSTAEQFAPRVIRKLAAEPWRRDVMMNVNFPDRAPDEVTGIEAALRGRRRHVERITEAFDPFGQPYYWIGSPRKEGQGKGRTDTDVCARGAVSVTPLNLHFTDRAQLRALHKVFP